MIGTSFATCAIPCGRVRSAGRTAKQDISATPRCGRLCFARGSPQHVMLLDKPQILRLSDHALRVIPWLNRSNLVHKLTNKSLFRPFYHLVSTLMRCICTAQPRHIHHNHERNTQMFTNRRAMGRTRSVRRRRRGRRGRRRYPEHPSSRSHHSSWSTQGGPAQDATCI